MGLSGGSVSKESDCKTWVQSVGREDPLEKGMATHASILAWRIPWTEEPGRLQSLGSQRVRHNWSNWTYTNLGNSSSLSIHRVMSTMGTVMVTCWDDWTVNWDMTCNLHWSWNRSLGTSLVVHWLSICLAMQATQVWSLVRKLRSHMLRSNKPHATTRESLCCNKSSHMTHEDPVCHN